MRINIKFDEDCLYTLWSHQSFFVNRESQTFIKHNSN